MKNTLILHNDGGNATIVTNSIEDSLFMKPSNMNSGCPVSSPDPFILRKENEKLNNQRYTQAATILRQYAGLALGSESDMLVGNINILFGMCDRLFALSPKSFCEVLGTFHCWFKLYVTTGSRDRGVVWPSEWDRNLSCPYALSGIVHCYDNLVTVSSKNAFIRVVLSILSLPKVLCVPVAPSLSSITSPFSGTDELGSSVDIVKAFANLGVQVENVRGELARESELHTFHQSMAAGPNGHALWSAHLDAYEVSYDKKLRANMQLLADAIGVSFVMGRLDRVSRIFKLFDVGSADFSGGTHSRLHCLYESGIKARIIAIGDYFTQSILTPIHKALASIVKDHPCDGTFDQDGAFEKVKSLTSKHTDVYSLDLSKATDRLPAKFQARILDVLFGGGIGKLWHAVMTQRSFMTQTGHKVRYAVGQPMGFLSSFTSLALAHHVIVQEAAFRAGLSNYRDYVILGDDIVLVGGSVANHYCQIMAELGVPISLNKSVAPIAGTDQGSAEFCSRICINGVEVTPLPVKALLTCLSMPSTSTGFWDILQKRGLFKGQQIWQFFSIFLSEKDLQKLMLFNALPREISGIHHPLMPENAPAFSEEALKKRGLSFSDVKDMYYFIMLSEAITKADSAVKRAAELYSILDVEQKVRPDTYKTTLTGTPLGLSVLVNSQAGKLVGQELIHPVQDVVKQVGSKVIEFVNRFNVSKLDINSILHSPSSSILTFTFDKKAAYTEERDSIFGDRRVLDKAFKNLGKLLKSKETKSMSFTGRIQGVSSLWMIKFTLGKGLVVTPHVPKIVQISDGGDRRLVSASKKFDFDKAFE